MIKPRFKEVYFNIAKEIAALSYAERLKVGAIAVKNGNILSFGFNGTPYGWENICEELILESNDNESFSRLRTKPETIHAEQNLIYKLAKSGEKSEGAVIFCTHAPCLECAKGIIMSGITSFYYESEYRSNDGLEFLKKCGVEVEKRG